MDNKQRRNQQREQEKNTLIIFIIFLVVLFLLLVFMNKRVKPKVEHPEDEYEQDVKTYDGSLQRNLSNPMGLE